MNAFLLTVATALALVLTAALAAPLVMDWNAYRAVMEEKASDVLGRPVEIAGDVDVRLVPFPTVHARDVRIGGEESGEGIDELSLRGGLMPLLSGELHVSEARLENPRLRFSVGPDGFVSWGTETEPAKMPLAPGQVRLETFEIEGGEIVVDDARSGRSYTAKGIDLTGSASSLAGPYKFEGRAEIEGMPGSLRVALGRVQPDGQIRVGATIRPYAYPVVLTLDGNLGYDRDQPFYRGLVTLENEAAVEQEAQVAWGEDEEPAEGEEGQAGPRPWQLEASAVAGPQSVVFEELGLRIGGHEHPITLSGAAQLEIGEEPSFSAVMSSRQIDVDRALGGGPDRPVPPHEAVRTLANMVSPGLVPIDGRLTLEVGSLVVGGNIVENLATELVVDEGGWRIARADAVLPGDTDVALSGRIFPGQSDRRFTGAVSLSAEQASPLASWLFRRQALLPGFGVVSGQLQASAAVRLQDTGFSLERLKVETDRNSLSGAIAYEAPESGGAQLDIALETDEFDIRGLPVDRVADTLRAQLAGSDGTAMDVSLDLDARQLVGATVTADDVRARMQLRDGELRVDELQVGRVAGLSLKANGTIAGLDETPSGRLDVEIAVQDLAEAVRAADVLDYDELAALLDTRSGAISPATARLGIESLDGQDRSGLEFRLDGEVGGTDLSGRMSLDGTLAELASATLDGEVDLRNDDATILLRQFGVLSDAAGNDASLALTFSGSARDGLSFRLSGDTPPLAGSAEGTVAWPAEAPPRVTADIATEIRDAHLVFGALGVARLGGLADDGRLSLHVEGGEGRYELTQLAYDGSTRLRGELTVAAGEASQITGSLEADEIALDGIVTDALGVDEVFLGAGGSGPHWSQAPFVAPAVDAWAVAIELSAPRATWDGVAVSDASFRMVGDENRLAFRNVSGRIWDGALGGELEFETLRGALNTTARLELTDARLTDFVWREDGRPVATGRLDLGLSLAGTGRTPLAVMSSLGGDGSFTLRDGTIRRMNPAAFASVATAADDGLQAEEEEVRPLLERELDRGALAYSSATGAVSATGGVLRIGHVELETDGLQVFMSGGIDLAKLSVESDWTLRAASEGEERSQEAVVVFGGSLSEPSRSLDVGPLVSYLTVREFEREVQRLEDLQADITERERLSRELIQLGRERRKREEAAEEAAGAAPDDAAEEAPAAPEANEQGSNQGAAAESAPSSGDRPISLDREQFRRSIEDLLRSVDEGSDRSGVETTPAPSTGRTAPPIRGSLAGSGQPMQIQPGAQ